MAESDRLLVACPQCHAYPMAVGRPPTRWPRGMKVLTDDPDWARDVYEARALAMMFVRKHGRTSVPGGCLQAVRDGLTVTYHPNRSPVLLTIDTNNQSVERFSRVLALEWNDRDAWRMVIETYHSGRWESRLKVMVHPRPWLKRWRAVALFTGTLPDHRTGRPA
jgi:hypothetical protein